jgi:murein DD-endopeptidase MepM/ murein hydrolase activator NlpD
MRSASSSLRSRSIRLALTAGFVGAAIAGCSQDASRFKDDPFTNPFGSRSDVTNTVPSGAGTIESQPLAGPPSQRGYSTTPTYSSAAPRSVPAAPAPAYNPPPQQIAYHPATTGSNAPARSGEAGWRWDGAAAVTLQSGETVDTIARRYGVPVSAILRANNLADASRVPPGARLVIPRYEGTTTGYTNASAQPPRQQNYSPPPPRQQSYSPPPTPAPSRAAAPAPAGNGLTHVVNSGETLYSLGRRYGVSHIEIARANGIQNDSALRIGQRLGIPGGSSATASNTTPFSPPPSHRAETSSPQRTAAIPEPTQKAAAVTPVSTNASEEPRSLGGSPQFRWPVRGRVISDYGPKANGQHNDGINLAVPEGTEVKAAEDGVVAYAGNELKGYGNLVLLRHADGWMTAYAHNSQLLVKRGDSVKRGQNIARAGQTGGVASPQVHFEIRKGSTPVDPTQYLAGL